jgi:hypothetical protein
MSPRTTAPHFPPVVRQLILGAALFAGIIVSLKPAPAAPPAAPAAAPSSAPVSSSSAPSVSLSIVAQATPGKSSPAKSITQETTKEAAKEASDAARQANDAAAVAAAEAADDAKDAEANAKKDDVNVTIDRHGIRVEEGTKKKRVTVGLGGSNRDYDSFEEFVHQEPWVGGMVVGIVFIVFMIPVLIIGLVVWYKLRRTRMLNETMVQLAERGVVPTAAAVSALATGQQDATLRASAAAAPIYEQAKLMRKTVAWSDLRKGVVMFAVGVSITFYSMFDDGSPNWLGLLLICLGVAYAGLWYFEDRAIASQARTGPPAGGA